MVLGNVERDYTLFLFERIMLCCKEVIKKKKKKGKDEITTYSLKGNIYITSIGGVVDTSRPELQVFGLQVFWKDGQDMETFALNCRNIEQVKLWMGRLEKLVDMERNRRKSVLDGSYTTINRMFKAGDNDEQDVDDYDANYQPSSRSRGRSDAYNTSDAASAAAKLFGVRTDDNYRTSIDRHSSNSNSRPSNVYQDIPANPAVPEEYRNRKSAPAQPRPDQYSRTSSNGYSIEARGPSIDRNQNEGQYYAHRSSSQRQSSKPPKAPHYEDIISNLIHTQNISSPVPPTKKFEQINTSYNTRTASDSSNQVISPESLKYPGQNSSRSSNTQTSEYRTSADARLQARLQQLRSSDPIDPSGLSLQLSQSPSAPDLSSSGAPPNLPLPATPKSPPRQGQSSLVKVKTHYGSDIFVVAVSAKGCAYVELLTKIERKIRLCGSELPVDRSIRMRFRDINGDFIAIQNDRDVEFAFQNALSIAGREMGVINLFVQ